METRGRLSATCGRGARLFRGQVSLNPRAEEMSFTAPGARELLI
jgi:hypothetical protein